MSKLSRTWLLTLALAVGAAAVQATPHGAHSTAAPASTQIDDPTQRIDVNRIAMVVKNTGSFAWDVMTGSAGLEYPAGSGHTAVYAAGLWLGAQVGPGGPRVSLSEYSEDFRPGAAPAGVPEDPAAASLKVYKLHRTYATTAERDAALADYIAGAVSRGAPPVAVLPDGSLGILGDQMLWSVYNDFSKGPAHNGASSALSLGVEVQQTTWGFDRPGPAGEVVFTRFRIVNRSENTLSAMRVAVWADPDLGGYADDLVGCDTTLSLGFCYNATNSDAMYGTTPPAVGFDLMRGPARAAAALPMRAFSRYGNGSDPQDSTASFRLMQGVNADGSVRIDPTSALPTTFDVPGDPVVATGWLDAVAGDRRLMLSSAAFDLPAGQTDDVVLAVLLARGNDRLDSVTRLKQQDAMLQTAFDADAVGLLAAPGPSAARLSLAAPWPNPARGAVVASFTLASEGEATLELLDLAGRRLVRRSLGEQAAGAHTVQLDLPAGATGPGLYFVRLSHRDGVASQRVAIVR